MFVQGSTSRTNDYSLLWASFEQSPIGIVHSKLDGRWIRVNQKFCDILGYEHAVLLKKRCADITYHDDIPGQEANLERLKAGDIDAFMCEKRCIRQDGTLVWVALTASLVRGPDGAALHLVGMVEDISARKQSAEVLYRTEEWFRVLIEHASDLVMVVEPEGVIRYASPAHKSVLGYEPAQLIGRNISEFAVEDEWIEQHAYVEETRQQKGIGRRVERRLRHADGSIRIVEAVSNNQIDNPAVRGIIVNARDVTERKRAEEALSTSALHLQSVVQNAPVVLFSLDATGTITYYDGQILSALGIESNSVVGQSLIALNDDAPEIQEHIRRALNGEQLTALEYVADDLVFETRYLPCFNQDGTVSRVTGIATNITERVRTEEHLRQSEAGFKLLFSANPQPMWVFDQRTMRFLEVNDAAVKHYGWSRDEFLELSLYDIRLQQDVSRLVRHKEHTPFGHQYRNEWRHRVKDGRIIDVEISTHELSFHEAPAVLVVISDITEQKRDRAALRHQALHDALTDLPNRVMLQARLEESIPARRDTDRTALLLLDLNHFKDVNDTFGHAAGDRLLKQVATRLTNCLRQNEGDLVARLGGDEFAILLTNADETAARVVAARIAASLDQPFLVHEQELLLGVSIGIALYPDHGDDGETMLRYADIAMYVAKRGDQSIVLYAREHDLHSPDRLVLLNDLRRAIEDDELVVYYQPKVLLATRQVVGVEALVRWPHPTHGHVPPDTFIPLAESIGLIKQLTWQVLEKALRQHCHWRASGLTLDIAVNLSPSSLRDPRFVETIIALLLLYNVQPARLRLELTENAIMSDHVHAAAVLRRLMAHGVHISIDDFGSGYSSLLYLKQLPVDELKIDKLFVQQMSTTESDTTIVATTIDLAHKLGLHVVAEGVEDGATMNLLSGMGCDVVQGYYIAPPLSIEVLDAWLSTRMGQRVS